MQIHPRSRVPSKSYTNTSKITESRKSCSSLLDEEKANNLKKQVQNLRNPQLITINIMHNTTPLIIATFNGNINCLSVLINAGVFSLKNTKKNKSALWAALHTGSQKSAQLLFLSGCPLGFKYNTSIDIYNPRNELTISFLYSLLWGGSQILWVESFICLHMVFPFGCYHLLLSCTEEFQGIRFFFIVMKYRNYQRCSRDQYRLMLHLMFHLLERSVKLCKDVR